MTHAMINDQNFDSEVLKSDKPVLVDFFATWCGPCQIQTPIIEELSQEYKDKAKVVSVDVDQSPMTASNYQIFSIPTLVLFKDGKEAERMIGLQQKSVIKEKIEKNS